MEGKGKGRGKLFPFGPLKDKGKGRDGSLLLDLWESDARLNSTECRSAFGILMPFTAHELIEPLQTELNCTQLFGMHCRGLVGHCILTVNHLRLMHDDVYTKCTWKSLYIEDSLLKMTSQNGQDDVDHPDPQGRSTGLVNVEITGLPIKLTIAGPQ